MTSRPLKIAIGCSFNIDLLRRPLIEALRDAGLEVELYMCDYGQWETEALNPASTLHQFQPEVVVVFADSSDLLPPLHPGNMVPSRSDAKQLGLAATQRLKAAIEGILSTSENRTVLVHN